MDDTSDNPDDGAGGGGGRPPKGHSGRANLMEAIRSAGGKAQKPVRLRRRREKKSEADGGGEAEMPTSGGDFKIPNYADAFFREF